ncbi:MAG TPA: hypothetical protein VH370_10495, partial [Humisphaera sp.]|nr:hypothetical protein [Humisphaera sp.]
MTTTRTSPIQPLTRRRLPQSAAAGIGYYLWLRARWALGLMVLLILAGGVLVRHHPARIAPDVIVGFTGFLLLYTAIFLVSVFVFANFKKALGKNDTIFPMHMMTLPVRTRGLVGLPMIIGAIVLAIFWVAFERILLVKTGAKPQTLWALLMVVGVVVWLQATAWLPYWFSILRIIVVSVSGFVVFTAIATAVFMCRVWDWPEPLCMAAICVVVMAAFPVALLGVAKIRRGEVGTAPWLNRRSRSRQAAPVLRPFAGPRQAQFWFELRRNVPTGPLVAAGVALVFCLAALGARREVTTEVTGGFGFQMHWSTVLYVGALISPALVTGWHGIAMARSDIWSSDIAMNPFIAIRPMTCNQIVKLKLRAALVSIALCFGTA